LTVNAADARVVSQSRLRSPPSEIGSTLLVNCSTARGSAVIFMSIV
jgi:hypothetical protein